MAEPKIKYTGAGEFFTGIPARDLSTEDYDALDNEQRATVRGSALYDYDGYKDKQDAPKAAEKAHDAPKDQTPAKGS